MTNLLRFRNVFLAAALLAAPAACKKNNETAHEADRTADRVKDHSEDLKEESRDVAETARDRREDLKEKAGDKAADTIDDMNDLKKEKDKDDVVDEAHDVAENARDNRDAVREKARDNVKDIADEQKDVAHHANELRNAENDFEYARMVRIKTLRGLHSVDASQTALINAFATSLPLVESDRGLVHEKLQIFQMRLDEAGNQIQALQGVPATSWEQRHDDANKAMERLEDARKDAWDALDDAKRLDRTSMR